MAVGSGTGEEETAERGKVARSLWKRPVGGHIWHL